MSRNAAATQYACDQHSAARAQYDRCHGQPLGTETAAAAPLPRTGLQLGPEVAYGSLLLLFGVVVAVIRWRWT